MIRIVPSVRSRARFSFVSRQTGFSVIELLMTVVLLAVGLALAVPSYRAMVEKRQITNGAEQMAAFINSAQGMAMRTNRAVTVSFDRDDEDDWCIGATAGETACDCTGVDTSAPACTIEGETFLMTNVHANDHELVHAMGDSDSGSYTFDPVRGFAASLDDALVMNLRSNNEDFRLNLMVNESGRVTLCKDSGSQALPGYAACSDSDDDGGISVDPGPGIDPDPIDIGGGDIGLPDPEDS